MQVGFNIMQISQQNDLNQGIDRHEGLTTIEVQELQLKWGKNELPSKSVPTWLIILRLV